VDPIAQKNATHKPGDAGDRFKGCVQKLLHHVNPFRLPQAFEKQGARVQVQSQETLAAAQSVAAATYKPGDRVKGRVHKVLDYGLLVSLPVVLPAAPPAEGVPAPSPCAIAMLHNSELSWEKHLQPYKKFRKGVFSLHCCPFPPSTSMPRAVCGDAAAQQPTAVARAAPSARHEF
jgi:hypothetical protein